MANAAQAEDGQLVAHVGARGVPPAHHPAHGQAARRVLGEQQGQAVDPFQRLVGRDPPGGEVAPVQGKQVAVGAAQLKEEHALPGAQAKGDKMDRLQGLAKGARRELGHAAAGGGDLVQLVAALRIGLPLGHVLGEVGVTMGAVDQRLQRDRAGPVKGVLFQVLRAREIEAGAVALDLPPQAVHAQAQQLVIVDGHVRPLAQDRRAGRRAPLSIALQFGAFLGRQLARARFADQQLALVDDRGHAAQDGRRLVRAADDGPRLVGVRHPGAGGQELGLGGGVGSGLQGGQGVRAEALDAGGRSVHLEIHLLTFIMNGLRNVDLAKELLKQLDALNGGQADQGRRVRDDDHLMSSMSSASTAANSSSSSLRV